MALRLARLIHRSSAFFLSCFWCVSLAPSALRAEPQVHEEHPKGAAVKHISLREAMRMGAQKGPGVGVAQAPQSSLADARRASNAIFTRLPQVQLQAGSRSGQFGPGPEIIVTITQNIPLAGVRGARQKTAAALEHVAEVDVRRAQLDAATRAALAWINLAEADRILQLRRESLSQAEAILRVASARTKSGEAEPIEQALAQGEVASARASVIDAEGLHFEASMELRFATGEPATTTIEVAGGLSVPAQTAPDEAALIHRAEREHPELHLSQARRDVARHEAELARASQAPSIGVGAQYQREGTGDQIITGIVSLPIPVSRPWAFEAARQRAVADTAEAQIALTRAELARQIRTTLHEREHARALYYALSSGALGPMREALRIAEVQLKAGTIDVTRVSLARQRLSATQEQVTRALADVHRADVRLMRATGALLEEIP